MSRSGLEHVASMPGQVFRYRSPVGPPSSGPGPGRRRRHRSGESRRDRHGPGGEFAGGQVDDEAGTGARKLREAKLTAAGSSVPGLRPGPESTTIAGTISGLPRPIGAHDSVELLFRVVLRPPRAGPVRRGMPTVPRVATTYVFFSASISLAPRRRSCVRDGHREAEEPREATLPMQGIPPLPGPIARPPPPRRIHRHDPPALGTWPDPGPRYVRHLRPVRRSTRLLRPGSPRSDPPPVSLAYAAAAPTEAEGSAANGDGTQADLAGGVDVQEQVVIAPRLMAEPMADQALGGDDPGSRRGIPPMMMPLVRGAPM
jgi:hypothetical protein